MGNLQRRMFTGPWQWSWDMSIKKSFKIKERHRVDLGADLINWMNHPTFYVPPATAGDYGIGHQLQHQQPDLRTDQLDELQSEGHSAFGVLPLLALEEVLSRA